MTYGLVVLTCQRPFYAARRSILSLTVVASMRAGTRP